MPRPCRLCSQPPTSRGALYCAAHRAVGQANQKAATASANRERWARWKANGEDPTHGGEAAKGRAEDITNRNRARLAGRGKVRRGRGVCFLCGAPAATKTGKYCPEHRFIAEANRRPNLDTDAARRLALTRPQREVICACCGKAFLARDLRAKTCSASCRRNLSRQGATPKPRGRPRKEVG